MIELGDNVIVGDVPQYGCQLHLLGMKKKPPSSKNARASKSSSKSAAASSDSYSISHGLDIVNKIALGIIADGGLPNTKPKEANHSKAKESIVAKPAGEQPIEITPPQKADSPSVWKSTTYNSVKLALNVIVQSSAAFPPLQSVAGALSTLITQYDVRTYNLIQLYSLTDGTFQNSVDNRDSISKLLPRVKGLQLSLSQLPADGDTRELERRDILAQYVIPNIPVSCWLKVLRRKFNATSASLEKILQQGKVLGYLNNAEHKNVISGLVGDIQDAMIDYQVIADILFSIASI